MVTRSKPATSSSGFWFNNLKAFPKLILGLSSVGATMIIVAGIGFIGLTAMKVEMQSSYEESTSALSNIGGISTNLGLYHSALLNTGRHTRKRDFDDAVTPLAELRRQVLAPLDAYTTVELQAASVDDRHAKHTAAALQKALKDYFAKEYTFCSWANQGAVNPIPMDRAEGAYFWDTDGKRYLDFASQLVNTNVGHQHPKVVKAIQEQAAKLTFAAPGMATEPRGLLGEKLAEITPGDLKKTFFTLGGAEANENAIKIARFYTGRHKILRAIALITGRPTVRWP